MGVDAGEGFETLEIGRSRTLLKTTQAAPGRVAILAFGSMVKHLLPVAEKLGATLIDMRFVKPLDEKVILKCAKSHDLIVTAEEGVIAGGAGSAVLEVLAREDLLIPTLQIGLPDRYILQGSTMELFVDAGIDAETVEKQIRKRLLKLGRKAK